MAASSSFGPVASSTWRSMTLARAGGAEVGHRRAPRPSAAPPPDSSAANDFGPDEHEVRARRR